MFKDFRTEWGYKSADWSATLFGTNLRQYCMENELDSQEKFKFICKKKSGVNVYVLDNKKMIDFLESEGIISKTGVCLIKTKQPNNHEFETEEE
jgi:hypothetical protein